MIEVRQATELDAFYLAENIREADRQEVLASGSPSPLASLMVGLEHSRLCLSVVNDDNLPVAIFGVVDSADPEVGLVWMLGTDEIGESKIRFLRGSREWVKLLHKRYPILANVVDARNTVHISWLRWLGFTFINQHPGLGPGNHPFFEFVRISDV
jgi:hypothetical protein